MAKKRFLRQDMMRYSKIGKRRKKLQKWIKPKGRHSKIRQKRKSYPRFVSIGYKKAKEDYGKIKGMTPILIYNLKDLERADKKNIIVIGKIGAKKKIEIFKKALDMKLKILNLRNISDKDAA